MTDWQQIATHISEITGDNFSPAAPISVGGGCINTAIKLKERDRCYFVKLNGIGQLSMFQAEFSGLEEIKQSSSIRVPRPICTGITGSKAYLVMEYIGFSGSGDTEMAGRQLAEMHQATRSEFGWVRDNTIGSTPQPNNPSDNWVRFWREQRLAYQLNLAAGNGYQGRLQERGKLLLEHFPVLIDHNPVPSLLHGDLWGGNLSYDGNGNPVIYDPAIYYGDREADLAMTELFGGFGNRFYDAYNEVWPLDQGYKVRKTLYNLYHILNHLNLFGGGYGGQALRMIDQLLAELEVAGY